MRIAFFVHGVSEADLARAEFYRQDLDSLTELGHDVRAVGTAGLSSRADLVFCWWWTYAWLAELGALPSRVPVVVTGVFDLPTFSRRPLYQRGLMELGARRAVRNIFVSQYEYGGVQALLGLTNAEYSPLCVDSAVYQPAHASSVHDGERRITAVCWKRRSNIERKLIPELVIAMKRVIADIPNARLTIAGPPDDGEAILREIVREQDLGRYVTFLGSLSREEKVSLMQRSDLYVQVSRYEGFGLAALEAMACGTPVLVSPAPPVQEVIGDCGNYVEDLTAGGIAQGILDALRDPANLRTRAQAGVRRAHTLFPVRRRRDDLERILRSIA